MKSVVCKYGDKTCPCQDGDACHYEGRDAWPPVAALAEHTPLSFDEWWFRNGNATTDDVEGLCARAWDAAIEPSLAMAPLTDSVSHEVRGKAVHDSREEILTKERALFEAEMRPILGDNPMWRESGPCELAWQAWQARAAIAVAPLNTAPQGAAQAAARSHNARQDEQGEGL